MASKKIFVNVSGPSAAIAKSKVAVGRTMDTVGRNKDIVAHTNKSQASGPPGSLKLFSDWKNAEEINKTDFSWYLEDNETDYDIHIYLFCGMIHLGEAYQVMGRVQDMCLVLNTNTIYFLARMTNKREKLRYRLSKIKYDTNETSTNFSTNIVRKIANNIVSMLIYIFSMHYCKDHSIFYKLLIIDMFYFVS